MKVVAHQGADGTVIRLRDRGRSPKRRFPIGGQPRGGFDGADDGQHGVNIGA